MFSYLRTDLTEHHITKASASTMMTARVTKAVPKVTVSNSLMSLVGGTSVVENGSELLVGGIELASAADDGEGVSVPIVVAIGRAEFASAV